MWLVTPIEFFGIAQKHGNATVVTLFVLARAKGDLDALRMRYIPSLDQVISNAGTDDRYRA